MEKVDANSKKYRQCTHCILDSNDDEELTLDATGVCNYCRSYEDLEAAYVPPIPEANRRLTALIEKVKKTGKQNRYDSILGLSGGVDSSYLALKAKQWGLRPLIVHFDNGWNSELAVNNIEKTISILGFDLHTLVIQWEEFRNLQVAFLRASVVDIEMITDHAIIATLFRLALKENIKFILSGTNIVTEAILPQHWIHHKADYIHIRAIQKKFVNKPFKTYPLLDVKTRVRAELGDIQSVSPLNLISYNKDLAKEELKKELGWRDYGGKHYESVFTRFYQGYILPNKFNIDKRRAHLSTLICSKQITREEALAELEKPIYDPQLFQSDYDFVLKKLCLTKIEFEEIMCSPPRAHSDYPIEKPIYDRFPLLKIARPFWAALKGQLTR
jgi:N-acetyl sugar amidotransferase